MEYVERVIENMLLKSVLNEACKIIREFVLTNSKAYDKINNC